MSARGFSATRARRGGASPPAFRGRAGSSSRWRSTTYPGHGRGITEFVQQIGGDLAVLGTRGRTNLRDLLIGSTAERVLRDAACSILAVRPEGTEDSP
jgi:nucleotide-binding universal stress UspA family protein